MRSSSQSSLRCNAHAIRTHIDLLSLSLFSATNTERSSKNILTRCTCAQFYVFVCASLELFCERNARICISNNLRLLGPPELIRCICASFLFNFLQYPVKDKLEQIRNVSPCVVLCITENILSREHFYLYTYFLSTARRIWKEGIYFPSISPEN